VHCAWKYKSIVKFKSANSTAKYLDFSCSSLLCQRQGFVLMWQFVNAAMRQCRKRGRALPACAETLGVTAQAGNAHCPMPNASRSVCRIAALPHSQIVFSPASAGEKN
jgi:hypothetical protein